MDFTNYTVVKKDFTSDPNLCDLFKLLAIETWKRVEYAYIKPRVKVFETTITQNLIFTINAFNDQYPELNIEILEAEDEETNGNDLELLIRYPKEGLEFYAAVQAKKINKNGKYNAVDHGDQIECLINYSKENRCLPLYLLYNHIPTPLRARKAVTSPLELAGCTIVSADYLYSQFYNKRTKRKRDGSRPLTWEIPDFDQLHPSYAFPWHEIVCAKDPMKLYKHFIKKEIIPDSTVPKDNFQLVAISKDYNSGFFPINTIKTEGWLSIEQTEGNTFASPQYYIIEDPFDNDNNRNRIKHVPFQPKSRVVITQSMGLNSYPTDERNVTQR